MSKFGLFLATVLVASLSADTITGRVVKVLDGDTVEILDSSNNPHRIRFAQIDAPEKSQDFGQISKQSLASMCAGKNANAEVETYDRYGRAVAVVRCEGIEANLEQVKRGMAWVYERYASDQRYFDAQKFAKAKGIGLWSQSNPTPPWEYRRR